MDDLCFLATPGGIVDTNKYESATVADLVREEDEATQRRRSNMMYFI